MPGIGIGVAFFGYWCLYYGITQVRGGNWGFLDLGIPGRWTVARAGVPSDSGNAITGANANPSLQLGSDIAGGNITKLPSDIWHSLTTPIWEQIP